VQAWEAWLSKWKAALQQQATPESERIASQNLVNPAYVPRQHLLQYAIEDAEKGDYAELHRLLAVLQTPFEEQAGAERYSSPPPPGMVIMLSCSS